MVYMAAYINFSQPIPQNVVDSAVTKLHRLHVPDALGIISGITEINTLEPGIGSSIRLISLEEIKVVDPKVLIVRNTFRLLGSMLVNHLQLNTISSLELTNDQFVEENEDCKISTFDDVLRIVKGTVDESLLRSHCQELGIILKPVNFSNLVSDHSLGFF